MTIQYDPKRERWVASQGGLPLASSVRLDTLVRKFPEAKVVKS